MHPDSHTYSGAMSKGYIKQTVSLLNTLFLPPGLFAGFQQHLDAITKKAQSFQHGPFVLETAGNKFLLEAASIEAAAFIENEWQYLLAGYPVMLNALENLTNHSYVKPLCFFVRALSISEEKLQALNEKASQLITITPTDHPANVSTFHQWLNDKEAAPEIEQQMYKHHLSHEVGECENEFWYTRLCRLNIYQTF